MRHKHTIAVDVDLTVIRTDLMWKEWLDFHNGWGIKLPMPMSDIDYDLGVYYPGLPKDIIKAFWNQPDLYDVDNGWGPIKDSVEALDNLSEYYNIVFVSSCKGPHYKSKYEWLQHHFPFMAGFVSTKEKHFVRCRYVIDDRIEYLEDFNPKKTKRILFNTDYNQGHFSMNSFDAVLNEWRNIGMLIAGCK